MKGKKVKELFRKKAVRFGSLLLAAVVLVGGGILVYDHQSKKGVPELVTYVDTDSNVTISSDAVPLGEAPKVKTKTTQKTKKKKVKLKTKAKRTYTKKKKPKSKTRTKTTNKKNETITVKTVTLVTTTERYKKGSKYKTVVTTTKKVVTTTTVKKDNSSIQHNTPNISTGTGTSTSGSPSTVVNGEISIAKAAPKVDSRVSHAFTTLGFKIYINSGVYYSGLCDTKTRTITLRSANDTSYHELGHFLAFIAGNADKNTEFQAIYNQEKGKYTAINKAYATQNSSEYFAESFKEYTISPTELQKSRPNTYNAIVNALSKVTDQQLAKVQSVYGPIWK